MSAVTRAVLIISLISTILWTGCSTEMKAPGTALSSSDVSPTNPLQVTVSILPQQFFVERIGGDFVSVNVMVLPGESPATYEPKPEQLTMLSNSVAYFSIGVPFENVWMDRIVSANSNMLMVDTARGIERKALAEHTREADVIASPVGDGQDHEEGLDPHIWLSPELVKIQARNISDALVQIDPEHQSEYLANLDAFIVDIDALERDINTALQGVRQREFIVFHPSWGYFADDFGLAQVAIEVGGQEPSAAELAALITFARQEGIKVIFAQPQFSTRSAETIAREIEGKVLLIDPLALDWLSNLSEVARTFAAALQ